MSAIDCLAGARRRAAANLRSQPASALMRRAVRQTGLQDFGSQSLEEPLDRLLAALGEEAGLNLFGRLSARWDMLRLLKNNLILRDHERRDASILERPVARPIFVMGLPRSGTTYLHALLAEDQAHAAPRCWQAIYPYPRHPAAGRGAGPDRVERQFRTFRWLSPEIRKLHPFDARTPQECTELTAHSFASLRFDSSYHIPSYRRWLRAAGHHGAYALHRRFLQHLQGARPRRWVLKSPDHVFALEALMTTYPDALIVISHRDPLKVLPSVARLTEALRRPFARRVDRRAIGEQVVNDWVAGAQRLRNFEAQRLWPADRVFHVHFGELTRDPVRLVTRLYAHFGIELTPAYRQKLDAAVANNPGGGYGRNVYAFEDFGLRAGEVRERFADYAAQFDVQPEALAA